MNKKKNTAYPTVQKFKRITKRFEETTYNSKNPSIVRLNVMNQNSERRDNPKPAFPDIQDSFTLHKLNAFFNH